MNPDNSFYVEAITGRIGPFESRCSGACSVEVKTENFMANENGIVVIPINSGGKRYETKNFQNRDYWTQNYPPDTGIFIESIMFKVALP